MKTDQLATPVTAIIPAYQEGARVADTVRAVRALPEISRVLVVDDGSTDQTAEEAQRAGAEVLRLPTNTGKGAALRAGLAACPGDAQDVLLLLDADLGSSAGEAALLLAPVLAGDADLTIARFPHAAGKAGFGLVKGVARLGTWLLTRQWLSAPLSGQRAARRWVVQAAPLADGYGLEVAMNVAAGDAGARILEVPVAMTHHATGRTLRGFLHRGRQLMHILPALLAATFGRTGQRLFVGASLGSWLLWGVAVLLALGAVYWSSGPTLYYLWPLCALGGLLWAPLCACLLGARRANYRGQRIPALGGLCWMPLMVALLVLLFDVRAAAPSESRGSVPLYFPLCFLAWMALGLLDDLWGTQERKGFRGHLQALRHGQFTTGGVKLLAGGALACVMAWAAVAHSPSFLFAFPVAALLIALSANALNLFDLRPGRAIKVWLLGGILVWLLGGMPFLLAATQHRLPVETVISQGIVWSMLPLLLLVAVCYIPFDFAGMMMLGDTGANPLGAVLGLYLALLLPLPAQVFAVLLLLALHAYAERASLTTLIARVRWLRWLDELGCAPRKQ